MMLSCKKATMLMEQDSEGKLSGWQKMQLRFHTFMCKNCGWFLKQTDFLGKKAQHAHEHIDVSLTEEEKAKMEEFLTKS